MIHVFFSESDEFAGNIIASAFERSVTSSQVKKTKGLPGPSLPDDNVNVFVFVSVGDEWAHLVSQALDRKSKVIVFGKTEEKTAKLCGLRDPAPLKSIWSSAAACPPAETYKTSRSKAAICWLDHPLSKASPFKNRPFLRFDFMDEWNNMGYGRITADDQVWSLAEEISSDGATVLAEATSGEHTISFVTLRETATSSLLWWNRPAGAADSAEWAVIEEFLANWRAEDRPCIPVISEIPWGYDTALTMRLDCDEDIASARPLFELYRERGIPFSLAVKTDQEDRESHTKLLQDVLEANGAVLSHSVSHAPQWGGSLESCTEEAKWSSHWLETRLPGHVVRYAVSPFHQNPGYVPEGLKRAGLKGFVGGIIANDPEMLLARGGRIPGDDSGVITHSQQCMLHGDCILNEGDPIAVTKDAFRSARHTNTLFGYLDHPFSPRYDYGWKSEEHRLSRHREFLDFIEQETIGKAVAWLNEDEALDWIAAKDKLGLISSENGFSLADTSVTPPGDFSFAVRYRGQKMPLTALVGE